MNKRQIILGLKGLVNLLYLSDNKWLKRVPINKMQKRDIWEKYTGEEEHGQILRWMRQLGYEIEQNTVN